MVPTELDTNMRTYIVEEVGDDAAGKWCADGLTTDVCVCVCVCVCEQTEQGRD